MIVFAFSLSTLLGYDYELSIASIFRDEAPYFKEWIEYHRMVGVEHFWLYNDTSTDNWQEVLKPYIDEGIVEVIDWPVPNPWVYVCYQFESERDALKRAKGKSKWLALIDIDEFILPMEDKNIPECLTNHFSEASGVYMNWLNFGTGGVFLPLDEPVLFHLTASAERAHPRNGIGKSVVRPDRTNIPGVWYPHHFPLLPGERYLNGDGEPMSFRDLELMIDGKHHDKYIRINHYTYKDENFFRNVRLKRAKQWRISQDEVWDLHEKYSKDRDFTIINFIQDNYPEMYEKFWKAHNPQEIPPQKEKSFVAANIFGQMGNNLFQVASACALAWDHQADPCFPDFDPASSVFQHVFYKCSRGCASATVHFEWNEPAYSYNPIPYTPNMRIKGYFQSEKYFRHHRQKLLALFAPTASDYRYMRTKYWWVFDYPNTVGVQIRDYKFEYPDIYPQYGKDYLDKALAQFDPSSLFVVSSNNLEFAKKQMPAWVKNVVYIENEANYIDLFLLSFCKHNVITNSSFGWWAAWLNQNPEKIVVRPAVWVKGLAYEDVCPKEWISISADYE